jgi:hypothetical protein
VAAEALPAFVMMAEVPGSPVVTVPTWMVAAAPGVPASVVKLRSGEGMPATEGLEAVKLPMLTALLKVALNSIVIG